MRQLMTAPGGLSIKSVISHDGRFYALVCGHVGARIRIHVKDLTGEGVWTFDEPSCSSGWISFHLVPGKGLCVSVSDETAVVLETGERFAVANGRYPAVLDYGIRRAWMADREKHAVGTRFDRAATTDTHVFMTGSAAKSVGDIAMGPTQLAKVKAAKGFNRGYVISYRRGGEARVMRLADRDHNPVHMLAADDGLTFLAVCRTAIYQIDADVD
jgi:hypothetical protein